MLKKAIYYYLSHFWGLKASVGWFSFGVPHIVVQWPLGLDLPAGFFTHSHDGVWAEMIGTSVGAGGASSSLHKPNFDFLIVWCSHIFYMVAIIPQRDDSKRSKQKLQSFLWSNLGSHTTVLLIYLLVKAVRGELRFQEVEEFLPSTAVWELLSREYRKWRQPS